MTTDLLLLPATESEGVVSARYRVQAWIWCDKGAYGSVVSRGTMQAPPTDRLVIFWRGYESSLSFPMLAWARVHPDAFLQESMLAGYS